jgi:hypothetical protein
VISKRGMMKTALLVALSLCLPGCNQDRLPVVPPPIKTVQTVPAQPLKPQITEITLEREPGLTMKPEPWYSLTLRSDLTATYVGLSSATREGTYRGAISRSDFDRITQRIKDIRYMKYESFYGPAGVDDIGSVSVSLVNQGKRKTVIDCGKPWQPKYEKEAPNDLKELEKSIDAAVANIKWVKKSNSTRYTRHTPSQQEFFDIHPEFLKEIQNAKARTKKPGNLKPK